MFGNKSLDHNERVQVAQKPCYVIQNDMFHKKNDYEKYLHIEKFFQVEKNAIVVDLAHRATFLYAVENGERGGRVYGPVSGTVITRFLQRLLFQREIKTVKDKPIYSLGASSSKNRTLRNNAIYRWRRNSSFSYKKCRSKSSFGYQ